MFGTKTAKGKTQAMAGQSVLGGMLAKPQTSNKTLLGGNA